jgi:HK97 family phage major capsid protein/HK97 family phage prohead protease
MPDPANYADESAFMADCVPMMIDEGKPQDQAVAACSSMWRDKAAPVDRAWSVLTVKAVDVEQRTIEGIASTPSVDRMGDIVEPMGAKFSLPMPLLWQHRHGEPVGQVMAARATKDGISIKAQFAKIDEPGELKNLVDKAWQSVKAGLVRGLSIGFKPLEYSFLDENGGMRFSAWNWFELSLVTIPANADAQISLIKSLDADLLAASGKEQAVVKLAAAMGNAVEAVKRPGASGKSVTLALKGRPMSMTTAEAITASEASRQAKAAKMASMMEDVTAKGETLDAEQADEYEGLKREVKALDEHLERLNDLAKITQAKAQSVEQVKSAQDASAARSGMVRVTGPKPEPGIRFARVVKALGMAHGSPSGAVHIAEQLYGDDQGVVNVLKAAARHGAVSSAVVTKSAVEAGGTATWGSFLVGDETSVFADFAEFLRPMTILGKFGTGGIPALRRVPFRTPLLLQTGGGDAYWTREGGGKGLTSFTGERTTLDELKAANIVVLTEELVRAASPSAETMVRDQMAAALAQRIDTDLVDPANSGSAGAKPASITNSVTPIASAGVTADHVRADILAVVQPFIDADMPISGMVWLMSASTALALSLMRTITGAPEFPGITIQGGTFQGIPVIVSEFVGTSGGSPNTRYVWLVSAGDIYLADDGGVRVDMSREASVQMDSAPTVASIESGSPSTGVATSLVSLWQTDSIGFRCERVINWKLRRTTAVAGLSGVAWGT